MQYLFTEEKLRQALNSVDWVTVVNEMYEASDISEPVGVYFDCDLDLMFAETMTEVDGLLIATAEHPCGEEEDFYWVNSWVSIVSPEAVQKMQEVFEKIFVFPC